MISSHRPRLLRGKEMGLSGPMLAACVFKEPRKEGVFTRTTEAGGIVVSYHASEQ